MKKNLLMILLLFTCVCQAQLVMADDPERGLSMEHRMDHLSNELQLTADQKAKLEAIFTDKHEKIRAIREESQKRIQEVLSIEQLTKWDAMKMQRFGKRHKVSE